MQIKKIAMLFLIPLMMLCSCTNTSNNPSDNKNSSTITSSTNSENSSSFDALSLTLESGQNFNYYLYTPKNATDNMPLILYLHGGSGKPESEEGNLNLLTDGDGLPKFVKKGQISPNSYIVFPQLPYGKKRLE